MVIYDHLASVLTSIIDNTADIRAGGNTWKRKHKLYLFIYRSGYKKVTTNKANMQILWQRRVGNKTNIEECIADMKSGKNVKYIFVYPKLKDFETNMDILPTNEWDMVRSYDTDKTYDSIFAVAVDTSYPVKDMFYERDRIYEKISRC